jgi:hypothetical protein
MWWLINTASASPSTRRTLCCFPIAVALASACLAQVDDLRPPAVVTAGNPASISTTGNGKATFYLIGPAHSAKRQVQLGQDIGLGLDETAVAGRYLAILCSQSCRSKVFYVTAAPPKQLSFLVHPSRAPVGQQNGISGVVFPLDKFRNLVLTPVRVDLRITVGGASLLSQSLSTQSGVAWFRANSGTRAGPVQLTASVDNLSVRRVVQQVASEPCNLRIEAQREGRGVVVQTQPIHDCSGNPVPDGTIVSFVGTDANGKSTVDAPTKKGVARAAMPTTGPIVVSAASGVVMGNELRVEGRK